MIAPLPELNSSLRSCFYRGRGRNRRRADVRLRRLLLERLRGKDRPLEQELLLGPPEVGPQPDLDHPGPRSYSPRTAAAMSARESSAAASAISSHRGGRNRLQPPAGAGRDPERLGTRGQLSTRRARLARTSSSGSRRASATGGTPRSSTTEGAAWDLLSLVSESGELQQTHKSVPNRSLDSRSLVGRSPKVRVRVVLGLRGAPPF